jgi:hypothetical protein
VSLLLAVLGIIALSVGLMAAIWWLMEREVDRARREHAMYEQIRREYAALKPAPLSKNLSDR